MEDEHEMDMVPEKEAQNTNCGFQAAERGGDKPGDERSADYSGSEEEEVKATPEILALRAKIARLVSSYPEIKLRSTSAMMDQLKFLDAEELQNVYSNAIIDLEKIRGTPSAEAILTAICTPIDIYFPGYMDECLRDADLKRDVEAEVINWLGEPGARSNICFRLVNNAYNCWKRAKMGDVVRSWANPPIRADEAAERFYEQPVANNGGNITGQKRKPQ